MVLDSVKVFGNPDQMAIQINVFLITAHTKNLLLELSGEMFQSFVVKSNSNNNNKITSWLEWSLFWSNKIYHNNLKYSDRQVWANSGDPDQMLHSAASDQGLQCLPSSIKTDQQVVKWTCSNFRSMVNHYGIPIFRGNMVSYFDRRRKLKVDQDWMCFTSVCVFPMESSKMKSKFINIGCKLNNLPYYFPWWITWKGIVIYRIRDRFVWYCIYLP